MAASPAYASAVASNADDLLAAVLTAADVPSNGYGIYPDIKDQPVLADGEARFRGEAVVAGAGDGYVLADFAG